ncbi:hypothetical protein EGW08_020317 [Elysia chlorotica]|uniref:Tetraspanin n=1 Tax=Elysia chlorotica TaxID=188477 RepID=A0A3S0Z8Q0_ELYCH|nr:hypothetical protein EGW08_020317 [Elysia chlorotica]
MTHSQTARVWDDPPDCTALLLAFLLPIMIGETIFAVIGHYVRDDQGGLLKPYLAQSTPDRNMASNHVCRNGTMDLCPTGPRIDLNLMLPDQWFKLITWYMQVLGIFGVLLSLTSAVSAYRDIIKALFVTLFLIPISVAAKWKLVDFLVFVKTPVHQWAKDELVDLYRPVFTSNEMFNSSNLLVTTMNKIMIKSGCCGIRGPRDLMSDVPVQSLDKADRLHAWQLPPACCVRPNSSELLTSIVGHQCFSEQSTWRANEKGCFSEVFEFLYNYEVGMLVLLLLVLILLQSLHFTLIIFVLLKRKGGVDYQSQSQRSSDASNRSKKSSQGQSESRRSSSRGRFEIIQKKRSSSII